MENNENIQDTIENENSTSFTPKKKNSHKKIWIVLGIIIVIAVIAIIVFSKIHEDNCTNNTFQRPTTGGSSSDPFGGIIDYKPIIYLYPEQELKLSLKLGKPDNITCSYPKYNNGWNIIAKPNGTLIDVETERELYSLYWEGIHSEPINLEEGFIVKGCDIIEFLEEKLKILGLNERETEEFIIYWLPILQENKYNYIRFATLDEINNNMPLQFSIEPDTLIRVLMQYKSLEEYIEVKEQKLVTPERKGFVAVEWGGTEIK